MLFRKLIVRRTETFPQHAVRPVFTTSGVSVALVFLSGYTVTRPRGEEQRSTQNDKLSLGLVEVRTFTHVHGGAAGPEGTFISLRA